MSTRNKFAILIGIIFGVSLGYYLLSTPRSKDLVLIGTVDANQVIVSPQVQGRLALLLVDEGSQVKEGELIAVLDPSELEAEERAATANIASLRHKVAEMEATEKATQGSTSSNVVNAQRNCRRRRRSCCNHKRRCSAPRATAAAPSNWRKREWLPTRTGCKQKAI